MPTIEPRGSDSDGDSRPGVLLVDDVDANLVALEGQLAALDCQLVRANTGNEALRQLLKREFAVILLDVQMPEMDGFEVARYVRANPATRETPIVFLTAMHEGEEVVLRGYGSGAFDFLFKPINPRVLRSKVQVFLELYISRKRLADEIEAHKKTLAELEAFNYSVSHDLRAPLRPLEGFSRVILEEHGEKLDETARGYLRRIGAAAQRMDQLIDDLLRLARMSRAEVTRQPVDLTGLAKAVAADLVAAEPSRQVEMVVPAGLVASGDPHLLRIMLENLLRNAWKFTGRQPQARVEVGVRPGAEPVYFVRDNGVGFDSAFAPRLFQPFHRLHAAGEFEGTGIGLAIVERIVTRHGGRVWAESTVGQGATFFFTLARPMARP